MPKISIIIPVYNVEKFLQQSLDCMMNQTLKDIEIICVDDCSTDNSLQILKEYANKDDRFVVIKNEKNLGTGATRNKAINIAKGDYIMFLDPDDWYELNACELAYNQITKNNNEVVIFQVNIFNPETNESHIDSSFEMFADKEGETSFSLQECSKYQVVGSFAAWRRIYKTQFLRDNNIYFSNTTAAEDHPFSILVYLKAKSVSVLRKPLYTYRLGPSPHKESRIIKKAKEFCINQEIVYDMITKNPCCEKFFECYFIDIINATINRLTTILTKNTEQKNDIYNYVRKFFQKINKDQKIMNYKLKINYLDFCLILFANNYKFFEFLRQHLYYSKNKKHIIFDIGILKIKIRNN